MAKITYVDGCFAVKRINRSMTEFEAYRILIGDLANKSHKECCDVLGLTYGQVYSARYRDTFKNLPNWCVPVNAVR